MIVTLHQVLSRVWVQGLGVYKASGFRVQHLGVYKASEFRVQGVQGLGFRVLDRFWMALNPSPAYRGLSLRSPKTQSQNPKSPQARSSKQNLQNSGPGVSGLGFGV